MPRADTLGQCRGPNEKTLMMAKIFGGGEEETSRGMCGDSGKRVRFARLLAITPPWGIDTRDSR